MDQASEHDPIFDNMCSQIIESITENVAFIHPSFRDLDNDFEKMNFVLNDVIGVNGGSALEEKGKCVNIYQIIGKIFCFIFAYDEVFIKTFLEIYGISYDWIYAALDLYFQIINALCGDNVLDFLSQSYYLETNVVRMIYFDAHEPEIIERIKSFIVLLQNIADSTPTPVRNMNYVMPLFRVLDRCCFDEIYTDQLLSSIKKIIDFAVLKCGDTSDFIDVIFCSDVCSLVSKMLYNIDGDPSKPFVPALLDMFGQFYEAVKYTNMFYYFVYLSSDIIINFPSFVIDEYLESIFPLLSDLEENSDNRDKSFEAKADTFLIFSEMFFASIYWLGTKNVDEGQSEMVGQSIGGFISKCLSNPYDIVGFLQTLNSINEEAVVDIICYIAFIVSKLRMGQELDNIILGINGYIEERKDNLCLFDSFLSILIDAIFYVQWSNEISGVVVSFMIDNKDNLSPSLFCKLVRLINVMLMSGDGCNVGFVISSVQQIYELFEYILNKNKVFVEEDNVGPDTINATTSILLFITTIIKLQGKEGVPAFISSFMDNYFGLVLEICSKCDDVYLLRTFANLVIHEPFAQAFGNVMPIYIRMLEDDCDINICESVILFDLRFQIFGDEFFSDKKDIIIKKVINESTNDDMRKFACVYFI